jgi:hypothetical protein
VRFIVENPGKKPLEAGVSTSHPSLTLRTRRVSLAPGTTASVIGLLALDGQTGKRSYHVRFDGPYPTSTELVVEVVPAVVRVDFTPSELVFRNVRPGTRVTRALTVSNGGNVPLDASLTVSESWLSVFPAKVILEPGQSTLVKVIARTRKTDHGARAASVRIAPSNGYSSAASVQLLLPEPQLAATAVEFGNVAPDLPAYQTVELVNVGAVRVACTLTPDQPWLAVSPRKVNLPVGRSKTIKLRAVLGGEQAGPRSAQVVVAHAKGTLLNIPVAATCKLPKPILGAVRRQTIGAVATDGPVVRRFRIANTGDGRLTCTVTADQPWIEILTPELTVGAGKKRRVEFRLNAPAMPQGTNIATIQIASNGGAADIPLSVTVVEPEPELEVTENVDLGLVDGAAASGYLTVRNVGVGMLKLQAVPDDPRLTVQPAEASIAPGPPVKLALAVALEGLAGGPHHYGVRFASNGGPGWVNVRFRLPVEQIQAPALIDLGDRTAGKAVSVVLRLWNTGTDQVALSVHAADAWVRPAVDRVVLKAGELVAIPYRLDLPSGVSGVRMGRIILTGRVLRQEVAVRVVVRRVELVVVPPMLVLGDMRPGEERPITFHVANRGDLAAVIGDLHAPGDLEVWIEPQRLEAESTNTLRGLVKLNARNVGREVRSTVRLRDETVIRLTARVVRSIRPRLIAAALSAVCLGVIVGLILGWNHGARFAALWSLLLGSIIYFSNRQK